MDFVALSTDSRGLPYISTVLAGFLRRCSSNTHFRIYTAGFHWERFVTNSSTIDFIRVDTVQGGKYPSHVGSAVFDRMLVMQDALEWDRCLIMDHDMLPLCDMSPYFEEDFDGNLLMGRMFGPGNTLGVQMSKRGGLPESLKYAEKYPYFYMGPMMNLKAMRKEGTWQKLLKTHEILQQEEQMALTIATEGRVKGVGRKWNMVPQWDNLADGPSGPKKSNFGTVGEAATWKNGLPEGLIHWTGYAKPWHQKSKLWRADLWKSEETSWEALRNGWWRKPVAIEILPVDLRGVTALSRRGWNVRVVRREGQGFDIPWEQSQPEITTEEVPEEGLPQKNQQLMPPFPDVSFLDSEPGSLDLGGVAMVRFAPEVDPLPWLRNSFPGPQSIVVIGPRKRSAIHALVKLGYRRRVILKPNEWPAGGPAPAALEYEAFAKLEQDLPEDEAIYLQLLNNPKVKGDLGSPDRDPAKD